MQDDDLSLLDTVEYGMSFRLEPEDLSFAEHLSRIHERAALALPPGSRYEIRAAKQMLGGYYLEEEDHERLPLFRQWLARLFPLRWRRKWLYTYEPFFFGWCVAWYSLPRYFAQKKDWDEFVHSAIPPAESDFNPMMGFFLIGRCSVLGKEA